MISKELIHCSVRLLTYTSNGEIILNIFEALFLKNPLFFLFKFQLFFKCWLKLIKRRSSSLQITKSIYIFLHKHFEYNLRIDVKYEIKKGECAVCIFVRHLALRIICHINRTILLTQWAYLCGFLWISRLLISLIYNNKGKLM